MKAHVNRFIFLLVALYVLGGIIGWPQWWYFALNYGGIGEPFRAALGPYARLTLLAVGGIGLLTVGFASAIFQRHTAASRLAAYLASPAYFGGLSLLVIIAGFRLQLYGFDISSVTIEAPSAKTSPALSEPVDFVWLDSARITVAYDQIAPELRLRERTVKNGEKASLEGGATAGPITAKGSSERSGEVTQSFSAEDLSVVRKTKQLINYLSERSQLKQVQTIESQSEEVKALDAAMSTLNDMFKIKVPEADVRQARRALVEKNLERQLPTQLRDVGWVLGMSLWLLKFSGGSVDDYAICRSS